MNISSKLAVAASFFLVFVSTAQAQDNLASVKKNYPFVDVDNPLISNAKCDAVAKWAFGPQGTMTPNNAANFMAVSTGMYAWRSYSLGVDAGKRKACSFHGSIVTRLTSDLRNADTFFNNQISTFQTQCFSNFPLQKFIESFAHFGENVPCEIVEKIATGYIQTLVPLSK